MLGRTSRRRWIAALLLLLAGLSWAYALLFPSPAARMPLAEETPAVLEPEEAFIPEPTAPPPTPEPTPEPACPEGLVISELMPANENCVLDGQGEFSDWIELANLGSQAVELKGLFLSDEKRKPCKYPLPDRVLESGEYLLIFCGGSSPENAPFSLSKNGESIFLSAEDGTVLKSVTYGETGKNISVCFSEDGAYETGYPTPGYPNTEQGFEDFTGKNDRHGALVIQEIVSFNTDFCNQRGKYYDWIELKNVSEEELDLSEYYLSDDETDRYRCRLPEQKLRPGGLLMVYCSGDVSLRGFGYCHADFKIGTGDGVYLSREGEGLSDWVKVPSMPEGGSFGRMDGCSGFFYFDRRTPEKPNGTGYRRISSQPVADVPQGVYEQTEGLTVSLSAPGTIYYTLNGDMPDSNSILYTEPIFLSQTAVLRAVAYEEGRRVSPCATYSYFLNEGHSLPVVSVVCGQSAFRDLERNFKDRNAECPAVATLFSEEGTVVFESRCSLKLHGASTRAMPKKSFKLIFRDRYGGNIWADPFENGADSEYHSLLLRGGTVSYLYILKDQLASLAAIETAEEPLALDCRYCVLYVNGSYHGIYALREAYSAQYGADHTGAEADTAEVARNRDPVILEELVSFAQTHPMNQKENYAEICKRLDVDSFATWLALEAYFDNVDPGGNIRYIRSEGTGGKWRAAFFDLDLCLFNKEANFFPMFDRKYEFSILSAALLNSESFRETLLRNTAALYHNGLGSQTMTRLLSELYEELDPEMPRNCKRWQESYELWQLGCGHLRDRVGDGRTYSWIKSLQMLTHASDEEIEQYFGDLSVLLDD